MTYQAKAWHKAALELRALGQSSRKIAKDLSLGKSTVNDFFTKHDIGGGFKIGRAHV